MKKLFAALLLGSLVLTGCGNNAANDAKQKVETKAEEVKQDAAKKVEETAAKVEEKAAEVKQDAAQVAQDAKNVAGQKIVEMIDATKSLFADSRDVPIAGVLPGIALDKVIQALGEPVSRDGDDVTFGNGIEVELKDDNNTVKKITVRNSDIVTPEGVAVGMSEYILNDKYGKADAVDIDGGEVEYKYFNTDKARVLEFTSNGGIIIRIENKLND